MNLQMETRGRLELSPLIDIVLVLLLIFMLFPSPLHKQPIHIRSGHQGEMIASDTQACPYQVILRMDRAGRFFIDKEQIQDKDFEARVSRTMQCDETTLVYVAADGQLPYGRVMDFLDRSRRAGAKYLKIVLDDLDDMEPVLPTVLRES